MHCYVLGNAVLLWHMHTSLNFHTLVVLLTSLTCQLVAWIPHDLIFSSVCDKAFYTCMLDDFAGTTPEMMVVSKGTTSKNTVLSSNRQGMEYCITIDMS